MIKIYDEIRVISQMREKEIPLGFVIPWENTKAKEKQLETATTWASTYDYATKESVPGKDWGILPNDPQTGFKVADSIRRYGWSGSGNVVWRMEDPRGWEFEIPSENMAAIIMSCGMGESGVITRPCIYGRDGARNVLLPEGTEFFANSKGVEELKAEKKAAMLKAKDVPVGSLVSGPSISNQLYLGPVQLTSNRPEHNGAKGHLFLLHYPACNYDKNHSYYFHFYKSFSVNEIHKIGDGTFAPEINERLVNSIGVEVIPDPKDNRYGYSDHYWDWSDPREVRIDKIKGLWLNPNKRLNGDRHAFWMSKDYYSSGWITKVTFL